MPLTQWEIADLLVWRISPFSAATRRTSLARASKVQPLAEITSRSRELGWFGAGTTSPDQEL